MTTPSIVILSPLIWILITAMGFASCTPADDPIDFPFDLTNPVASFKLDKELNEISGLVAINDKQVAAINDEQGNIYVLSLKDGEVEMEYDFGKKGDYEAISYDGTSFYVLETNGRLHIYEVQTDETTIHDLETPRGTELEALSQHPSGRGLLTAYKTTDGQYSGSQRGIYSISLKRHVKLSDKPLIYWKNDDLKKFSNENGQSSLYRLVAGHLLGQAAFQPSGLAVHPISGHYYIISAVHELVMIWDPESNRITNLVRLDPDRLPQPEGITFLTDGSMILASENGGSGKARLEVYRME